MATIVEKIADLQAIQGLTGAILVKAETFNGEGARPGTLVLISVGAKNEWVADNGDTRRMAVLAPEIAQGLGVVNGGQYLAVISSQEMTGEQIQAAEAQGYTFQPGRTYFNDRIQVVNVVTSDYELKPAPVQRVVRKDEEPSESAEELQAKRFDQLLEAFVNGSATAKKVAVKSMQAFTAEEREDFIAWGESLGHVLPDFVVNPA